MKHSLADLSRAEKHLSYKPTIDFEEAPPRTVGWYRSQIEAETLNRMQDSTEKSHCY